MESTESMQTAPVNAGCAVPAAHGRSSSRMLNVYSFTRMMELLMRGCVTKTELIEQTGLHHATVGKYVRHMHGKKLVRVGEWRRCTQGKRLVPAWTLNVGGVWFDAPRPVTRRSK